MHENSSLTKNKLKTRLGKRLTALYQCISPEQSYFYDLCCDHGALGRAVLESQPDCRVVFNDIHPDIMARLADLLESFDARHFTIETMPAEQVALNPAASGTVLLAGVGDEQCNKILSALFAQKAAKQYQYIVSPATKTHNVRKFLVTAGVNLLNDQAITENKRTYEIITFNLTDQGTTPISLFGDCWEKDNLEHQAHLKKLIQFYSVQLKRNDASEIHAIVQHYKDILQKIS